MIIGAWSLFHNFKPLQLRLAAKIRTSTVEYYNNTEVRSLYHVNKDLFLIKDSLLHRKYTFNKKEEQVTRTYHVVLMIKLHKEKLSYMYTKRLPVYTVYVYTDIARSLLRK